MSAAGPATIPWHWRPRAGTRRSSTARRQYTAVRRPHFILQTNGMLLDEAALAFLARHRVEVRLSLDGYTAPEIARLLDTDRTCVYDWICSWNQYRLEGLKEGHRCGRPSGLTKAQKIQLTDIVESGPVAYGLTTGVWTSPLLRQVIAEEFDVQYHPGHVRKLLHALGCSVQRPTTRLVQADPAAQNKWVRYTYPLPKYSPEFNLVERIWHYTRKEATHNRYFATVAALCESLFSTFQDIQEHPDEIVGYLQPYL